LVYLTVLHESYVHPRALVLLTRPGDDHSFPIFAPLGGGQVVRKVQSVHQTSELELIADRKEGFSQVLGSLQVFQVSHKELCRVQSFIGHIMTPSVRNNDDFIHAEDRSCLCDLVGKVGFKFEGLGKVNDRSWDHDCNSVVLYFIT
jgi:hypothetical protein